MTQLLEMTVKNVVEQNGFGIREDMLEVRQVKVGYFVVCFLLGNSPASGVYMPTFRNTLSHLHTQVDVSILFCLVQIQHCY
jgi:hypothetical protein